jgi:hypothetical protein
LKLVEVPSYPVIFIDLKLLWRVHDKPVDP